MGLTSESESSLVSCSLEDEACPNPEVEASFSEQTLTLFSFCDSANKLNCYWYQFYFKKSVLMHIATII